MGAMACPITGVSIVYSTIWSGADQRKHQSSASLSFLMRIHQWPVNSLRNRPVTRKMFLFDTSSCPCQEQFAGTMQILVKLDFSRTHMFWIYAANPIEIYQKAELISWCIREFNPLKYLDAKDTHTRNFWNSKRNWVTGIATSHECAARLIKKCVKKFWKNTHTGIWQKLVLISYVPVRSLNITRL